MAKIEYMYCPKCYRGTSSTAKFCSTCGTKTSVIPTCSCGEYIGLYSGYCSQCGKQTALGKKTAKVAKRIRKNG